MSAIDSSQPRVTPAIDRKAVERAVRAHLADWRGLLTKHVQDGRALLRQLLVGPLKFIPDGNAYRFEGEAAIGRMLAGTAGLASVATFVASPTGFEPVF